MKKVIIALAAALSLSAAPASADTVDWNDSDIMPLLNALGIMEGDGYGDYSLDRAVSRAEMAKITVNSSSYKDQTAIGMSVSPFKDVPSSSWAAPYILNGSSNGLFKGYIDGSFRPDDTVTYEEAVTMMLRVLGYDDSNFGASYPYGQVNFAKNIDLLDNVDGEYGTAMTRSQIARMVYNALRANNSSGTQLIKIFKAQFVEDVVITDVPKSNGGKVTTSNGSYYAYSGFDNDYLGLNGDIVVNDSNKLLCFVPTDNYSEKYVIYSVLNNTVVGYQNGTMSEVDLKNDTVCYKDSTKTTYSAIKNSMEMGDVLSVKYTSGGDVDYCIYETGNLEGPIKVVSGITGITTNSSTQYMRDGNKVTSASIVANDIIYYSEDLNMVLAYSNKVSGIYQSASPSRDNPTSVTISGVTYEVEGVEAYNDLSSSGSFKYGDTITVCLGKDGSSISGVVTSTSSASTTQYGYVIDAGKKSFDNSDGTAYSSYYVTIVTASGSTYDYAVTSKADNYVGNVVKVAFSSSGSKVTSVPSSSGLSGRVNSAEMKIGSTSVADDCVILDTVSNYTSDEPVYKKVYLQRLDGMNLSSGTVKYYHKNSAGEIDELILSEATGDCYSYGMVTNANTSGDNKTYKIDINGEVKSANGSYSVSTGMPCKVRVYGNSFTPISNLKSYNSKVSELTTTTATIGSQDYKLSDEVVVYEEVSVLSYNMISLNEAIKGNYTYTAYYDKTESEGGRIRVIVAQGK